MRLVVVRDPDELATAAADIVQEVLERRPDALIVLPTGNTPLRMYRELARRHAVGHLPTARMRVAQLDEYLGVAADDPQSLFGWMQRSALGPMGVTSDRVIRFAADAPDPTAACRAYDAAVIEAGGVDLAVLGIGRNGHLGFNEPPSGPDAPTRVVELSAESRAANAAYWSGDAVPERALTAGMSTILGARQALLLASGSAKAEVVRRLMDGDPSPELPASMLKRHPDATLIVDRAAHPGEGEA